MKRLRIKLGFSGKGGEVVDMDTGKVIEGVRGLSVTTRFDAPTIVTLELLAAEVEIDAEVDDAGFIVHRSPTC